MPNYLDVCRKVAPHFSNGKLDVESYLAEREAIKNRPKRGKPREKRTPPSGDESHGDGSAGNSENGDDSHGSPGNKEPDGDMTTPPNPPEKSGDDDNNDQSSPQMDSTEKDDGTQPHGEDMTDQLQSLQTPITKHHTLTGDVEQFPFDYESTYGSDSGNTPLERIIPHDPKASPLKDTVTSPLTETALLAPSESVLHYRHSFLGWFSFHFWNTAFTLPVLGFSNSAWSH